VFGRTTATCCLACRRAPPHGRLRLATALPVDCPLRTASALRASAPRSGAGLAFLRGPLRDGPNNVSC